ncbi:hypothetical protein [Pontiella sulfatireligans]|uniref:Uncharacterized protein n=1 Tax=Pontiella sulfatireligans TaxID=2750658 RepID=A0A6C2UKQ3_9BACT|nr:hypothetical protein [Pontiella sulfatireligans]VGO20688.1 hypothetical protein SCARR_02754 [Pontiella sulfatireligans]
MRVMNNHPAIAPEDLEKYSAAISLSDMEIFVFPELLYSLVLANIMSPRIWEWKNHDWFRKLDTMKPYKKIQRLKQFIIDHYEFNLDLDTWGLTTKESEIARFAPFMDEKTIGQSNALFGYEGDKHYFSLDIRKHFGLDKYTSNIIPFWKTETLEAMDAFKYKDDYRIGAGECVSLSTLYAAALFIICDIPLEDIFLIATPLHSQNFINVNDGVLTNNRRLVTKNMWFNGTDLTARAQRALRNEQVTIVANNTGYIHAVYPEATIAPESFELFRQKLDAFTTTDITFEMIANFLRDRSEFQKCFQIQYVRHGKEQYLPIERAYGYEHGSPYKVSDNATRDKLLDQIDEYDFYTDPIEGRIQLNKLSDYLKNNPISHFDEESMRGLAKKIDCTGDMDRKMSVIEGLVDFIHLDPELPDIKSKQFNGPGPIEIKPGMPRGEIIQYLETLRTSHRIADLAFYASRDLAATHWSPFLKAALERNPVVIEATKQLSDDELIQTMQNMPNESIYNGTRVAQPDEVWNFQRGDGLECAIALANAWKSRHPETGIELSASPNEAILKFGEKELRFESSKGLNKTLSL